jgi:transposase InsO family protein
MLDLFSSLPASDNKAWRGALFDWAPVIGQIAPSRPGTFVVDQLRDMRVGGCIVRLSVRRRLRPGFARAAVGATRVPSPDDGAWRRDYKEVRPHSAIGNKPPISLLSASVAHGRP